jgi:peptide chain release factor 2
LQIDHLTDQSQREGFWDDPDKAQRLMQKRSGLEAQLSSFENSEREVCDLMELLDLAQSETDSLMLEEVASQLPELQTRVRRMELSRMLSGPVDSTDAIVSIHPGAGGTESQDWASILLRMYLRWAERKGFKTEMVDYQSGDEAGIKDATFICRGPFAYGFLRAENGVHRLIRISPFDANARRHTSFAAVFVVPDLPEDDDTIEIRPEDLKVDTFRAGGKGGQHVNKTESAIRITHIPSGIIVQCQAERSQHKNRSTAMKVLRGRLYEKARQEREAEFTKTYASGKLEIGFGSQVRSYTLAPYQLVKDERTEKKESNVQAVLDGDIDEFIEEYLLMASETKAKDGN